MNLVKVVTPVFQPARRADWKVGVTACGSWIGGNLPVDAF